MAVNGEASDALQRMLSRSMSLGEVRAHAAASWSVYAICRCPDCSGDCTVKAVSATPWLQVAGHAFNDLAEADSQLVLYRYWYYSCAFGCHACASVRGWRTPRQ